MKNVRGRDLETPVLYMIYDGERRPLRFDNRALRIAEDVYADEYEKDVSIYEILTETAQPKMRAVQALFFGAMVSGGYKVPFAEFDEKFDVMGVELIRAIVSEGIRRAFPTPKKADAAQADTDTRGRG